MVTAIYNGVSVYVLHVNPFGKTLIREHDGGTRWVDTEDLR